MMTSELCVEQHTRDARTAQTRHHMSCIFSGDYHDDIWGTPVQDARTLFAQLSLCTQQCGVRRKAPALKVFVPVLVPLFANANPPPRPLIRPVR